MAIFEVAKNGIALFDFTSFFAWTFSNFLAQFSISIFLHIWYLISNYFCFEISRSEESSSEGPDEEIEEDDDKSISEKDDNKEKSSEIKYEELEEVKANINADEQQENANDDEIQETKQEKNGDDIEAKATEQKPVTPPAPAPSAITSKVEFAQEDHPIDDEKKHLEQEKEIISEQIENQKLVQEQEVEPLEKSLQPNISEGPLTLSTTVEDSNVSEKEISFEQVSEGSLQSDSDGQDQIETDADDEVKDGEDDEENEVCKYISVSGIEKTPFKLGPD